MAIVTDMPFQIVQRVIKKTCAFLLNCAQEKKKAASAV